MVKKHTDHTTWSGESWEFNKRAEFEQFLDEFNIDTQEVCLIGSVCRNFVGLRENNDVDFIIDPAIREEVQRQVEDMDRSAAERGDIRPFAAVDRNSLQESSEDRFGKFGISDGEILYDPKYHVMVDGFKVLRIEINFSALLTNTRKKAIRDYEEVKEIILNEGWNWDFVRILPPWRLQNEDHSGKTSLPSRNVIWSSIQSEGIIKTAEKGGKLAREMINELLVSFSTYREKKMSKEQALEQGSPGETFYAILFPPAEPHFDQIELLIDDHATVVKSEDLRVNNEFSTFIHDIYSLDDYIMPKYAEQYVQWPPVWHLEKAKHELEGTNGKIRWIKIRVVRPHDQTEPSSPAVHLKSTVRKEIDNIVNDYQYSFFFFMSVNDYQTARLKDIIENINNKKYITDQTE